MESFYVKLDSISLKLDTLCNLTSAMLTRQPGPAEPGRKPVDADPEPGYRGPASEADSPPVAEEPALVSPGAFLEPAADAWRVPVAFEEEAAPSSPVIPADLAAAEQEEKDFSPELGVILNADPPSFDNGSVSISIEEVEEELSRELVDDDSDFLPGFPAKVSDILFADEVTPEPGPEAPAEDAPCEAAGTAAPAAPEPVQDPLPEETGRDLESGPDERHSLLHLMASDKALEAANEAYRNGDLLLPPDTFLSPPPPRRAWELPETDDTGAHELDEAAIPVDVERTDVTVARAEEAPAGYEDRPLDEHDIFELETADAPTDAEFAEGDAGTLELEASLRAEPEVPAGLPGNEEPVTPEVEAPDGSVEPVSPDLPSAAGVEAAAAQVTGDLAPEETPFAEVNPTPETEIAQETQPEPEARAAADEPVAEPMPAEEPAVVEQAVVEGFDEAPVGEESVAADAEGEVEAAVPAVAVTVPETEPEPEARAAADEPVAEPMPAEEPAVVEQAVETAAATDGEVPDVEEDTTPDPAPWKRGAALPQVHPEAVLGIDFGTSLSKVALRTDAATPPRPVPLGITAHNILRKANVVIAHEAESEFVEDSLIYFDHNDFVFCGMAAKQYYLDAAQAGNTRPPIQNLKTFFIRGGASLRIHDDFFPASEALTAQDVLAVYLAYLFRLTRHYLQSEPTCGIDLDSVFRKFSIPACTEDRYREEVKSMISTSIAKAFCLEKWLKDELVLGVPLYRLRDALTEATVEGRKIQKDLSAPAMTEGAAAGYNRILASASEARPPLSFLVIDVGAGFTDFALLTASRDGNGHGPEGNSVRLLARGGVSTGASVWDTTIRTLLYNKLKLTNGARRNSEFKMFRSRMEMELRTLKEKLVAVKDAVEVDVSPFLMDPVRLAREELEGALPVKAALFTIRDGLRNYLKQSIKTAGIECFDPAFTEILVTGGGSFIPSVVECVRESASVLGPAFGAKVRADYVSPLYADIAKASDVYPILAVALGSAEKGHPVEQTQAPQPVAEPKPSAEPAVKAQPARPKAPSARPGLRLV